jgi:hypothetical protein
MLVSRRSQNRTVVGRRLWISLWISLIAGGACERSDTASRTGVVSKMGDAVRFSRWSASRENLEGSPTYVSIA